MAKKKEPESWADKLQGGAEVEPSKPLVGLAEQVTQHEDPLVQKVADTHRIRDLEIQVKVLRRELYLAKARILELELDVLGVRTES